MFQSFWKPGRNHQKIDRSQEVRFYLCKPTGAGLAGGVLGLEEHE